MATNQRGHGKRVRFTASANRSSDDFVYEDGFHGVCVNDVANTERGVLDIDQVEVELTLVATAAPGDAIYIAVDGTTLSKTSTNHRFVGVVTATPTSDPDDVPSGKMWMLVAPQNATVPTA